MIKRLFADNFQLLAAVNGTLDLKFPPECIIMDSVFPATDEGDIIEFLEWLFNDFLKHYNMQYTAIPLNKEESITVAVDAEDFSYTKILAPDGKTVVMEEFLDKESKKSYLRGVDGTADVENIKPFMMLKDSLYNNFQDDILYILGEKECRFGGTSSHLEMGEIDEVIRLCNKIIPSIFPEITSVGCCGEATHEKKDGTVYTFSRNVEGGGYNQALDIIKGLYLALNTESIVVFRNWSNHLHPILKDWFMKLFKDLGEKKKYKGTILIEEYYIG